VLKRDYRNIIAGAGLSVFGLAAAAFALSKYSMGTISRMGPGMMPVSLGLILAFFGLAIFVPALSRRGPSIDPKFRSLTALSISIICFALMIDTLGLVPAVFSAVVIATLAEKLISLKSAVILGAALSLVTWAIFILGLGLPIAAFDWRF
jgi:hypothetical protein